MVRVGQSADKPHETPPWSLWEVVLENEGAESEAPFIDEILGPGDKVGPALRKMEILRGGGFPPSNVVLEYDTADDDSPKIYILKCKPTCWRLYFHADQSKARFIYLLAVCKKKQKRDDKNSRKARRRFDRIAERTAAIRPFRVPDR